MDPKKGPPRYIIEGVRDPAYGLKRTWQLHEMQITETDHKKKWKI